MATNQEIVDEAARELGKIDASASLDNTAGGDAEKAMSSLNDMMEQWRIQSIDLNWFPQDTLTATSPIPSVTKAGVVSSLAVKLGTTFDIVPSQQLYIQAKEGRAAIANMAMNQELEEGIDNSHMNRGDGHRNIWDIETDII